MTLYRRLQMKHGLRWTTNRPPFPWHIFWALLILFLAYGIVGYIDYEIERATELERTAKEEAQRTLRDCLNGEARWYYQTPRPKPNSYGRTYVICRTEELEV